MEQVASSTELLTALNLIEQRADNGDYEMDGRFGESIDRFQNQVLSSVEPVLITLTASRIELRFDAPGLPAVDYRLILTGVGIGPISSLEALDQAIQDGLATGRLNAISLTANGATHLALALAPGGYTLTTGVDVYALNGAMPTTFAEMAELVSLLDQFDEVALTSDTPAERAAYFADLAQYGVTGFSVRTDGTTLAALAITATGATLTVDDVTMTLTGTLPDDFGAIASTLFDAFTLFEQTGNPLNLAQLAGFGVDSFVITNAGGTELLRMTGPITTVGDIDMHTVTGTAGNDVADLNQLPFGEADAVVVNLLAGDDSATLNTYDLYQMGRYDGVPVADLPQITLNGGTGVNTLILQNYAYQSGVEIDLADGQIYGYDLANPLPDVYRATAIGFQQLVLEGQGITVYGSGANETVRLSSGYWGPWVEFEGGAGSDTLDLSGADQSDGNYYFGGISQADLANFDVSINAANGQIALMYAGGGNSPDLYLEDVEFLRVQQNGNPAAMTNVAVSSLVTTTFVMDGSSTSYAGSYLNDVIVGTAAGDEIRGHNGNDLIAGNAGNDSLYGGDGADTLNGGTGDDFIFGGATNADLRDVVYGGDGNDSIDGGAGNDELNGGNDNDTVIGGLGSDTIIGNDGNDVLGGSGGSDIMFGNAGNDVLNGGFGYDRMNGGAGADSFYHAGVFDHGSDWVQDYNAAEGDILTVGLAGATRAQFQVNVNTTVGAGDAGVAEAFVIYRPTGQILWALVDGADDAHINLNIGGQIYDLMEMA